MSPKGYVWRPFTQEKIAAPAIRLERAEGAYLIPALGPPLFDALSSWWVINHGHCHPVLVEALRSQAEKMDQVLFANFTHAPAEEVAERLVALTPESLTRVFFSDDGSTAVEVALKMALQACLQRGLPQRQKFVAFAKAYHGDTVGAMSVSGDSAFNRPYAPTLFDVLRVEQPEGDWPLVIRAFERVLEEHHESLAGVILEPLVQGAGGIVTWPPEVVRSVVEKARQRGVLVIFDEIMTGFGRTGSLFAFEQVGVVPDLLCLSKGLTGGFLPLAVTLASEEIFEAFLSPEKRHLFFHGHSFTGNPVSCAVAAASLRLFETQNYASVWATMASVHDRALKILSHEFEQVRNVRVCGTIGAFEWDDGAPGYLSTLSQTITERAMAKGLFIRPLGNTVYMMPPFCATEDDLEFAWQTVGQVLRSILADSTEKSDIGEGQRLKQAPKHRCPKLS